MLPAEVISNILAFATTYDVCRCRGVNSGWYSAANEQGCVHLCLNKNSLLGSTSHAKFSPGSCFCRIHFNGRFVRKCELTDEITQEIKSQMDSKEEKRKSWYTRTRGHLPEPRMPELPKNSADECNSVTTRTQAYAKFAAEKIPHRFLPFLLPVDDGDTICLSLNLSSSSVEVGQVLQNHDLIGSPREELFCSSSMKGYLCQINLCGLTHLQHISMRGMSVLKKIFLPASVIALDANSCTKLEEIHIPIYSNGSYQEKKDSPGFLSVNWSGCRSLWGVFGPTCPMERAMAHIKELDLSYTSQLPSKNVAATLQSTTCLQSASIRYVATDEVIMGLSRSTSSRSGILKLVDVAFSPDLTDGAVNALIDNARRLERLNMRGCRSVSSECYNRTPITLQQRQEQATAASSREANGSATMSTLSLVPSSVSASLQANDANDRDLTSSASDGNQFTTTSFRKRKGDNLFFFASSSLKQQKPRAKLKDAA